MIWKILKIKNVGRFKSFTKTDDELSFKKNTVIFGYNTYGKSTITSIFHSLKDGDIEYIQGRKTFGASTNQEIEILYIDKSKSIFPEANWQNKEIEIFDNEFISSNVFYGDQINIEQRSSLYEIFIGNDVRVIKEKINVAKKKQGELEKARDVTKSKFLRIDLGSFDEFLTITNDDSIEVKIKELLARIKQHENLENIKGIISKTPLRLKFEEFKEGIAKTLDLSVEDSINKHIEKNWKDIGASRDFLSRGLELIKEGGNCVFCGQDISPVSGFVADLGKVFSDEYRKLKEALKDLGDSFIKLDLEKSFLEFESNGLSLKDKLDYDKLIQLKDGIDEIVKAKQNDLNLNVDFENDKNFIDFLGELDKISKIFDEIIIQPSGDFGMLNSLKTQLKTCELVQYRFSKYGECIVKEFQESENNLKINKAEIDKLNIELSEGANKIFHKNEDLINRVLKGLNANFILKDFTPRSHMGQVNSHFCEYHFVIDDKHDVLVSNKARKDEPEPQNKPHFKNTLSDSDKRLLAFAFFLAKLGNDVNLKNKIVVLDDPFSSFDENRKDETINMLMNLRNNNDEEPMQKIILTHDKGFLCRLFPKLPPDSKVLKIHYSNTDGSTLDKCDVESEFMKDTYFTDLEYIKYSVESSTNIDEALKKVRPCLEHILKRKYYFLLSADTLKNKSVGKYLEEIDSACPIKQAILDDNWHEDMHDGHSIMQLNEPAKISKLSRFLELIKEL